LLKESVHGVDYTPSGKHLSVVNAILSDGLDLLIGVHNPRGAPSSSESGSRAQRQDVPIELTCSGIRRCPLRAATWDAYALA
jgi:hypothetical protein